jgi:hypothetical protein
MNKQPFHIKWGIIIGALNFAIPYLIEMTRGCGLLLRGDGCGIIVGISNAPSLFIVAMLAAVLPNNIVDYFEIPLLILIPILSIIFWILLLKFISFIYRTLKRQAN